MRGTPCRQRAGGVTWRIIPADAGNTVLHSFYQSWSQDHPRGCGEHQIVCSIITIFVGSSPRMRGTRMMAASRLILLRIIPADAGNTPNQGRDRFHKKDHPRGCGEHIIIRFRRYCVPGSSPRMRGTQIGVPCCGLLFRIIPADAGNTSRRSGRGSPRWDHPRGCGEHPVDGSQMDDLEGIIPADAGNTSDIRQASNCQKDHPRGCGEHVENDLAYFEDQGSSPRMRGTLHRDLIYWVPMRIIPADAGNTRGRAPRSRPSRDHPRGCGEHYFEDCRRSVHRGSSPRMRGTQPQHRSDGVQIGIIPADAGNTLYG